MAPAAAATYTTLRVMRPAGVDRTWWFHALEHAGRLYAACITSYANQGKLEPGVAGADLEASSVYLTAVGTLPFTEKLSGYAKAGFQRWDLDTAIPGLTGSTDDSGTDPTYGVGLQYRFNDNVALRGEYNRFEIEDLDADLARLQVRFDF